MLYCQQTILLKYIINKQKRAKQSDKKWYKSEFTDHGVRERGLGSSYCNCRINTNRNIVRIIWNNFWPHLLIILGLVLFLNLIKMDPQHLVLQSKKPIPIILLTCTKLLVIPLILYSVTKIIYPSLAIAFLLLSEISTGLGAPNCKTFQVYLYEYTKNDIMFPMGSDLENRLKYLGGSHSDNEPGA
jgi:hypothetical protein